MSKLYTLQQKLDSLGKKVEETAESQTADLKARLCRLEDTIESNCANVQTYSKKSGPVLTEGHSKGSGHRQADPGVRQWAPDVTSNVVCFDFTVQRGGQYL